MDSADCSLRVETVLAVADIHPEEGSMVVSLTQQLLEQNQANRAHIPTQVLDVMDRATAEVAASGIADSCLGVGSRVPEFTLPDANGVAVSLASKLAEGPVVLTFYRGGWCPYCSTELRALQARLPEIAAAGATLIAISPETPDNSLSTAEKLDLTFTVLSDEGNRVAESFGLVVVLPEALREIYQGFGIDLPAANGDDTFRLPIPATYVIRTDGTIAWSFADPDYTNRADPDDVITALGPS